MRFAMVDKSGGGSDGKSPIVTISWEAETSLSASSRALGTFQ